MCIVTGPPPKAERHQQLGGRIVLGEDGVGVNPSKTGFAAALPPPPPSPLESIASPPSDDYGTEGVRSTIAAAPEKKKKKTVRFAPAPPLTSQHDPKLTDDGYVLIDATHSQQQSSVQNPQEAEADDVTTPHPVLARVECVLTPSSEMSVDEKSSVWWQPRDYDVFMGTARLISGEVRRRAVAVAKMNGGGSGAIGEGQRLLPTRVQSEGYANILSMALSACDGSSSPSGSSTADGNHLALNHPLDPRLFAYLTHWVRVGHSRRGLERWSVSYHGKCRSANRADQVSAVLDCQRLHRLGGSDLGDMEEGIRRSSERRTRTARLFALAIGHADAAAVGFEAVAADVDHAKSAIK